MGAVRGHWPGAMAWLRQPMVAGRKKTAIIILKNSSLNTGFSYYFAGCGAACAAGTASATPPGTCYGGRQPLAWFHEHLS